MKINKRNAKRFSAKALGVVCEIKPEIEVAVLEQDLQMLEYCAHLYSKGATFRRSRKRNVDFFFGRQLRDLVKNPEGGRDITEEELLRQSGYPQIVCNLIYKIVRAMVSNYSSNTGDPYCVARDRDEQKIGEMLSATLQYIYQKNNLQITNTNSFEEFVISSMVGWRVGYGWDEKRLMNDVYIETLDMNRVFFDDNLSGQYFENVKTIGLVHDMDLGDVEDLCDGNLALINVVKDLYTPDRMSNVRQLFEEQDSPTKNFYNAEPGKCRVIEVWFKREEEATRYWDTLTGEIKIVPRALRDAIYAENELRQQQMVEFGGNAEDAALCTEIKDFTYRHWVCRYMTPEGYIIREIESPYDHNSHPFVIGAHPMIDGEIHSLVEVTIPTQKAINRLLQRIEFMRMASAKGVLIIPEQLLEGKDINQVAKTWAKSNGVIALKWKEGIPMPQQIVGNSSNTGDMEMVQMQMSLLEDITGVHRAMQGKPAQSGTPAALYAMELQNSQTSTSDIMNWYHGLIRERDLKIVQVFQQFYNTKKYMNLVGSDYSEESKWYDPEKGRDAQVDVNIIEGSSSAMYRSVNEGILMDLMKLGGIDVEMFLESSSMPFSDKLLDKIRAKKKELEQQQAQMQAQGQQPNPMIAQAMGQGEAPAAPPQQ